MDGLMRSFTKANDPAIIIPRSMPEAIFRTLAFDDLMAGDLGKAISTSYK
jgi:hypothetical protein